MRLTEREAIVSLCNLDHSVLSDSSVGGAVVIVIMKLKMSPGQVIIHEDEGGDMKEDCKKVRSLWILSWITGM